MLTYENQMFLDVLATDGLLICCKGLDMDGVMPNLLRVYSDPGNLVLVLGTDEDEEKHYITRLRELQHEEPEVKVLPKRITTEYSASERSRIYLLGGVLFVTTRILVVDMLTDKVPIHLITGILVCRAHKTAESCQEAFILRLFRQKNRTGFIKETHLATVQEPSGYSRVDRVMRHLFVGNLFLWPRFRAEVTQCLAKHPPDVIEIHVDLTKHMMSIQTATLDLINFTIQEVKRLNPTLESYDELVVENALSKSFQKLLQRELDPVWHQLSWKTKQLVADLKTLRTILTFLTQYDCITFYSFVSALRTTENALRSGGWMILDSAETLFLAAKKRIFGDLNASEALSAKDVNFERNPKWRALEQILDEIRGETQESALPSHKVLVLSSDERTACQLQDLVTIGSDNLLARLFNKAMGEKYGTITDTSDSGSSVRKEPKHKGAGKKSVKKTQRETGLTLTQMCDKANDEHLSDVCTVSVTAVPSPVVIFQSTHIGSFELQNLICELKPKYVVLYDSDVTAVRLLEVFQAKNPDFKLRVYFLMYDKSVEEQAYLTSLRKEKEAFENLMREKATMIIPEEREGRTDGDNPDLVRDASKASDAIVVSSNDVTRRGGGVSLTDGNQGKKIIVDMREFRSELPSLIHKRGIDIEPVTIEVGDYILTPDICVERKSVSDLIGSLQNGRLFNQATNMTRFYPKPMLLIEFDQNKPFALQGKYYLSRDISSTDIVARLQLLTIHFPKLRILWSPSPHATAELFEDLKKGREEPDAAKAASLTVDLADEIASAEKYNPSIFDFVSKLPGVNSKNVYSLVNTVDTLDNLIHYSKEELSDILGSVQNGEKLFAALQEHAMMSNDQDDGRKGVTNGRRGAPKFKSKRRKLQ